MYYSQSERTGWQSLSFHLEACGGEFGSRHPGYFSTAAPKIFLLIFFGRVINSHFFKALCLYAF
jgi:hypothetical protein